MIFHIKHATSYSYSQPVFCEPFEIRLRPRQDNSQRLLRYRLTVEPQPVGLSEFLDAEGNVATRVWFEGVTVGLTITSSLQVQTLSDNPFCFLLRDDSTTIPIKYNPTELRQLAPYRDSTDTADAAYQYAHEMLAQTDSTTVGFLTYLADKLHHEFQYTVRDNGDPWTADETLRRRTGSCRDLAVLFNELCRRLGFAARFVSGYSQTDPDAVDGQLHAWSEVYLPGAGWKGFDPSCGLITADLHVPLAHGSSYQSAAPTRGSFRGTGAKSVMTSQVVIRTTENDLSATPTRDDSGHVHAAQPGPKAMS